MLPYGTDLREELYDHTYSYILQISNYYTYSYTCLLIGILFVYVYEDFMTFTYFTVGLASGIWHLLGLMDHIR